MIEAPHMLMIGSSGKNSGKTVLACKLTERFRGHARLVGAKVTTIHERFNGCPRGGNGCGACDLNGNYCVQEEEEPGEEKDTQRLLASGASRVFWLRAKLPALEEGAQALLETIGPDAMVICESNSLRTVVRPALFFMARRQDTDEIKESAANVIAHADRIVYSDGEHFDLDLDNVEIQDGSWVLREKWGQ